MAVTVSIPDTAASFESKIDALTRELAQARGGLAEALRREAATAEVLEVISRSPTDVQPVFDTIVASAVSLCGARMGAVYRFDGELLHLVAHHNYGPEVLEELRRTHPRPPQADQASGRAILARAVVQLEDTLADPHYRHEIALAGDFRSILAVPMLRNGAPIGVIVITRSEVGPFSNGHIELLKTFTDQAVIAIENVRLFEAEQARTKELQARSTELAESLEYQTSTSEVLSVISRSPNKLQPVLDAIVQTAARLCTTESAFITRLSDNQFHLAAANKMEAEHTRYIAQHPISIDRGSIIGRVALDRRVIHVADVLADPEFDRHEWQTVGGQRTVLGVPLLLERALIGVMILFRTEVAPFTDKQIELVETFADQAVIAIENARLFEAEQARAKELSEALEFQTASSEVLGVISSAPGKVGPVFDTILESARRLCGAEYGHLLLYDGATWRPAALHNLPKAYADFWTRAQVVAGPETLLGRILATGRPYQVADALVGDGYRARTPLAIATVEWGGARTLFGVPLLKDGKVIGAIVLYRKVVRAFNDKQIALLLSFAHQAVIAIENTRLFEAEQIRTKELQESLEYQTATSEVLGVISRSPNELQPVLDSIVETAQRLCSSDRAQFFKLQAGKYHLAAHKGTNPEFLKFISENPISLETDSGLTTAQAARERCTVHVPDVAADPAYSKGDIPGFGRGRSVLAVPLMRRGEAVGVITVARDKVQPFTDRQISLVETFANQAVIALNNVGLFEEVQARTKEVTEALEYQKAITEVLSVISSSPNNLQPVLDAIVTTAGRLCEADYAHCRLERDGLYHVMAKHALDPDQIREIPSRPVGADRTSLTGRTIMEHRTIHVPDVLADPEDTYAASVGNPARTMLGVPLLRDGVAIGVIGLFRRAVKPFTQRQIDLVTTFADQAIIAINNTRLFEEVQVKTKEVTEALKYQIATSDVLGVISRSPNDLQPVLDTLVELAAPLCEASTATLLLRDGDVVVPRAHVGPLLAPLGDRQPLNRGWVTGRAILDGRTIHLADILEASDEYPEGKAMALRYGHRATLVSPLMRDGIAIGAILLRRSEARPFSNKQIALLQTFADQAVIAINNARLFEEVQARTKDLEASLDRQTATGEVLSAISRSPSQTQPVFDVIVATAARLCRAEHAVIFKREGDGHYHVAAANNAEAEWLRFVTDNPIPPGRGSLVGRTVIDGKVVHIPDCLADPEFTFHTYQRVGKFRTMLGVPLMHQGSPVGVIGLLRNAVEPFSDTEIDLVTTFADQAVIAIENARLFEEVQARTRELTRSVGELRALGEVGQTVSSSLDPQVVLPRILEHACDMSDTGGSDTGGGAIYVFDKVAAEFHLAAGHNMSEELIAAVREHPILLGESLIGQCAERRAAVQFVDLAEAPPHPLIEMHIKSGVRALLAVPLLHQDEVVGALVVRRKRAGAFADPIVNLMQTFANQSAIAVHNARLFREIEDKSRQLEIASQHKSQFVANMSHELRTPLAAMLGYAELLQENIYGALPAKATPIVERIRSNGRHLLGLINTVLDISKIESGQFKLNLSEYALSSMVETVRVATESLAAGKKLAFYAEVAKGLPHGLGDEQRLTQVLLNLVGNAIKFTDTGEVRIRASVADGRFTVAVSDTGPGIPPEERDRVFEKFHQIDNSSTRTKGGTGLGLAIAKDIVEMHGGRLWVESTLGKGATFRMELPVRAKPSEASAA